MIAALIGFVLVATMIAAAFLPAALIGGLLFAAVIAVAAIAFALIQDPGRRASRAARERAEPPRMVTVAPRPVVDLHLRRPIEVIDLSGEQLDAPLSSGSEPS